MEKKKGRKTSIIAEVAILFLIAMITTGILVYMFASGYFTVNVTDQTESHAAVTAEEVKLAITEYPAHEWLVGYWYTHGDSLDVEYDATFSEKSRTAKKCRIFAQRHPDLLPHYLTGEQCESLPPEDQKLYAEIVYSWLLTDLNEIKEADTEEYLYCVVSRKPYRDLFFLFSAAEPGEIRGETRDTIYTLGTTARANESQKIAMGRAARNRTDLAYSGDSLDYYSRVCTVGDYCVLVGLTYSIAELKADIASKTRAGASIAILHQVALSVICLLLLFIFLLRPLRKLQACIRSYSETKDGDAARVGLRRIRSRNELGQLSDDMVDLTREIDDYAADIQTITSERERIETELDLARGIQASMLPNTFPPYPDRDEFDIFASMDPAKEIGGDFYDYFLIDEDHLCMVIADVAGKGIPAALFMMTSMTVISQEARNGRSPAQILANTNEVLCRKNDMKLFVTVWIGILEISTGRLVTANAGHEYPVLKTPEGGFETVKFEHDFIVGGVKGVEYEDYEILLRPGSVLFLYTDGIPEAMDADEECFGMERMLAALNEEKDLAPDQLLRQVRGAVDDYVKDAEQFDDLTMLCLAYKMQEYRKSDEAKEDQSTWTS